MILRKKAREKAATTPNFVRRSSQTASEGLYPFSRHIAAIIS